MNYAAKHIIILLTGFIFIACSKSDKQEVSQAGETLIEQDSEEGLIRVSKKQFKNEKMGLAELKEQAFPEMIKATGLIDVPPNSRAIVSAHIGGYIKDSPFLVGDQVKKGQRLLTIENIQFLQLQQEYLETFEQLTFLEAEFERQNELYKEKITSKKSFLKAESDFKRARVRCNSLRKKLELLNISPARVEAGQLTSIATIYAPLQGDITKIDVSTGTYVSPSDEIMEIVNTEHIHLEIKIFERDALRIKKGQKVLFSIPESSSEKFEGEVYLIGKSIGEDRTVKVHVHMDEDSTIGFIPGMFVESVIFINQELQWALPESALIEINDKKYILKLKTDQNDQLEFEKTEVVTGATFDQQVMIKNHQDLDLNGKYLTGGFNLIPE